jgi:hypothetical protein
MVDLRPESGVQTTNEPSRNITVAGRLNINNTVPIRFNAIPKTDSPICRVIARIATSFSPWPLPGLGVRPVAASIVPRDHGAKPHHHL